VCSMNFIVPDCESRHASDASLQNNLSVSPRRERPVRSPPPDVADLAPSGPALTVYDEEHAITYLRMLDAEAEGADWREVSRIVLHIDPEREPYRAQRAFESHLARAKWVSKTGYRQLLRRGWPNANPNPRA
jgi:hypothetical protein